MTSLFGEATKAAQEKAGPPKEQQSPEGAPKPSPSPGQLESVQQLINRAVQEFEEYQRLTAEGKLAEAGKKLEEHKRTLEELKKITGKP